jgi:hypothetical protein
VLTPEITKMLPKNRLLSEVFWLDLDKLGVIVLSQKYFFQTHLQKMILTMKNVYDGLLFI